MLHKSFMMSGFKTVNIQREIQDTVRRVPSRLIDLFDLSPLSDSSAFDTHAIEKIALSKVTGQSIISLTSSAYYPLPFFFSNSLSSRGS